MKLTCCECLKSFDERKLKGTLKKRICKKCLKELYENEESFLLSYPNC